MRSSPVALACALLFVSPLARADASAQTNVVAPIVSNVDTSPARADALVRSVHASASALRRRWDELRAKNEPTASCLEAKVEQAIALGKRADQLRAALATETAPAERARLAAGLERIDERRAALVSSANVCITGVAPPPAGPDEVKTTINPHLAPDVTQAIFSDGPSPLSMFAVLLRR